MDTHYVSAVPAPNPPWSCGGSRIWGMQTRGDRARQDQCHLPSTASQCPPKASAPRAQACWRSVGQECGELLGVVSRSRAWDWLSLCGPSPSCRVCWQSCLELGGCQDRAARRCWCLLQVSAACRCRREPPRARELIRSSSFWWFPGRICTVREKDELWSGSHTQPRAEPRTAEEDSPSLLMVHTWLHAEDRGTGGNGRVQEGAHPSQPSPCPGWCQC